MSEQIKRSDLGEKDLTKEIRDSLDLAKLSLDKYNDGFREAAKLHKKVLEESLGKKGSQSIRDSEKAIIGVTKAEKEYIKLLQEQERLEKLKIQRQSQEINLTNKQAAAQRKHNKQIEEQNSEYKKLVRTTRDAKNESKELGAQLLKLEREGKKSTREYRRLENQYRRSTRAARGFDRQLKKLDNTVGDNFRNVGNYRNAFNRLNRTIGQFGVALGVGVVVRRFGRILVDFDQSMQNLAAITGENTDLLRDLAKELGENTVFTASQAADAMTKLAMAGFNTNQILEATPGVLSLAAAGQLDLAEAADIATNILTGMGLAVSETDRVMDVIAKTATSTNTTVQTIGESFKEVAPTANNLKIPLEEVAAMIGLLGNSGIKGTDATTSLNTALNRLSKPTAEMKDKMKELNVEFFDSNGQFIGITETIRVLNDRMKGLTDEQRANAISTIFGARANKQMTALLLGQTTAMIDGTEKTLAGAEALRHLTKEYENSEGAAKAMADTQIDSLGGSLAKLNSAFEGYIINLSDSTNAANGLKGAIKFLAENLASIIGFIGKAILAFAAFKSIQIAVRVQQTLLNREMLKSIFSFKNLGNSVKDAGGKVSKFGGALRSVGWVAAISFAFELAKGFWDIATGAKQAEENTARLNAQINKGTERANERLRQRLDELQKNKELVKTDKERQDLQQKAIKATEKDIELVKKRRAEAQKAFFQLKEIEKKRFKSGFFGDAAREIERVTTALNESVTGIFIDSADTLEDKIAQLKADIESQNSAIQIYKNGLNELSHEQKVLSKTTQETSDDLSKNTDQIEKNKKATEEVTESYEAWSKTRRRLTDEEEEREALFDRLIDREQSLNEQIKNRKRIGLELQVLNAELYGSEKELREARIKQIQANLDIELEDIEKTEDEKKLLILKAQRDIKTIEKEGLEARRRQQKEYFELAQDFFEQNSEKRIELIDKEIEAAEKQLNKLEELAKTGKITEEQSLKQQQIQIDQANRRRIEEEKRLQRIKQATVLLDVYSSKVEAGDKTPLVSTIRDVQVLRQFISSLPSFDVGADRLDNKGQNIDGKQGFLSINHPDEKILTAEENKSINYIPSSEVVDIVKGFQTGALIEKDKFAGATQIFNSWNMQPVLDALKVNTKAIQSIPDPSIMLEQVSSTVYKIIVETNKGNSVTRNIKNLRL